MQVIHQRASEAPGSVESVVLVLTDWDELMMLANAIKLSGQDHVSDGLKVLRGEIGKDETEAERVDEAASLVSQGMTALDMARELMPLVEGGAFK